MAKYVKLPKWERIAGSKNGWSLPLQSDHGADRYQLIISHAQDERGEFLIMLDNCTENRCGYIASAAHVSQAKVVGNMVATLWAIYNCPINGNSEPDLMEAALDEIGAAAWAAFTKPVR